MIPKRDRKSPYTSDLGSPLIRVDAVVVPGDTHFPGRERRGRPSPESRAELLTLDTKLVEFTDPPPAGH